PGLARRSRESRARPARPGGPAALSAEPAPERPPARLVPDAAGSLDSRRRAALSRRSGTGLLRRSDLRPDRRASRRDRRRFRLAAPRRPLRLSARGRRRRPGDGHHGGRPRPGPPRLDGPPDPADPRLGRRAARLRAPAARGGRDGREDLEARAGPRAPLAAGARGRARGRRRPPRLLARLDRSPGALPASRPRAALFLGQDPAPGMAAAGGAVLTSPDLPGTVSAKEESPRDIPTIFAPRPRPRFPRGGPARGGRRVPFRRQHP